MDILHATPLHLSDAQLLLDEYFDAINVTKRDTPQDIAAFLSDSTSAMWIVYVEGVAAGCVVLRPLPSVELAVECKRLYVRPRFRGQGLAEPLLDAMEARALASGASWVYLDSKDDLKGALHIYSRRGYQACERYNDNPQATVFMRKELRVTV
jgi:GNAT superfamily N-acetyltransferase